MTILDRIKRLKTIEAGLQSVDWAEELQAERLALSAELDRLTQLIDQPKKEVKALARYFEGERHA